jgi:hypothetical protein
MNRDLHSDPARAQPQGATVPPIVPREVPNTPLNPGSLIAPLRVGSLEVSLAPLNQLKRVLSPVL